MQLKTGSAVPAAALFGVSLNSFSSKKRLTVRWARANGNNETPQANLVAGMKWLLGTYTGRFNRRHKLFGHLFSGRYKALIVDGMGNGYLKAICDYVHLNPVQAKLLRAEDALRVYQWSSWPEYLKSTRQRWPWLRVNRLLGEYRIPQDSAVGRRYLEEQLEARRQSESEADYRLIRRG